MDVAAATVEVAVLICENNAKGPFISCSRQLVAQLQARELGKIEAFIPIFNQMLLSLSRWECRATTMLHANLNVVHHLTSSLIRTNHWKILKNPQNGFFKSIFSSVATDGAQMKLMKLLYV